MKRSQDFSSEAGPSNPNKKQNSTTSIMDQISSHPGLQHIIEKTFINLDYKDLMACKLMNKSVKQILDNIMFWLRKWKLRNGLSQKNLADWTKAIKITRNTNLAPNIDLYIKKVIQNGHIVDVPCFIDELAVEKFSTGISFDEALVQKDAAILQILAPMMENFNAPNKNGYTPIHFQARNGHIDVIKVLAPLTENPNTPNKNGQTPIYWAAFGGHIEVIKFLASLTENPNVADEMNCTPVYWAATNGHLDALKILVPFSDNPNLANACGYTPFYKATIMGHNEVAKFLESYAALESDDEISSSSEGEDEISSSREDDDEIHGMGNH